MQTLEKFQSSDFSPLIPFFEGRESIALLWRDGNEKKNHSFYMLIIFPKYMQQSRWNKLTWNWNLTL